MNSNNYMLLGTNAGKEYDKTFHASFLVRPIFWKKGIKLDCVPTPSQPEQFFPVWEERKLLRYRYVFVYFRSDCPRIFFSKL